MRTILLADDSVTIQKVIELTFMDDDYHVVSVSNGDAAVSKLGEITPDLVIADVHMPGASGYQVCRASKQVHPNVPVLLLVGTFEPFDEREAAAAAADANLKKPFDSQELLSTVRHLLGQGPGAEPAPAAPVLEADSAPWPDFDAPLLEEPETSSPAFAESAVAMPFSDVEPLSPPFEELAPPPAAELSWSEERIEIEAEPAAWEPTHFESPPFEAPPVEAATFEAPSFDVPSAAEPFAGLGADYEPLRFQDPAPVFEPEPPAPFEPAWAPEPLAEPSPSASDAIFEPEPLPAFESPVPAPEPFAFEPAPASFEPEPVELAPEPLAFEPEPAAFEPEPAAFDPAAFEPVSTASAEPEPAEEVQPEPAPAPSIRPEPEAAAPPVAAVAQGAGEGGLSDADIDRIARRIVELVGERIVRDVAWEVVPDLAELAIKERLKELEAQLEA